MIFEFDWRRRDWEGRPIAAQACLRVKVELFEVLGTIQRVRDFPVPEDQHDKDDQQGDANRVEDCRSGLRQRAILGEQEARESGEEGEAAAVRRLQRFRLGDLDLGLEAVDALLVGVEHAVVGGQIYAMALSLRGKVGCGDLPAGADSAARRQFLD